MIEWLAILFGFVAGLVLGLFYFGSLWLTVRNLPRIKYPLLVTLGSFLGRMAVTLTGFYLVMDGSWTRLVACLVGFILARQVLINRYRPADKSLSQR